MSVPNDILFAWSRFFKAKHVISAKLAGKSEADALALAAQDTAELKAEMEAEVRISERATKEANALLEVVAICDERIAFNEDLLAFIKKEDIRSINERLHTLFDIKRNLFRDREAVLLEFEPGIEKDIQVYKAFKLSCRISSQDPLLLEHVYDGIEHEVEREGDWSSSKQKQNPNCEWFHYNRMKKKLKPFLAREHEAFQKRFHRAISWASIGSNQMFDMLKEDVRLLLKRINELKAYIERNNAFITPGYKVEILDSLEGIASSVSSAGEVIGHFTPKAKLNPVVQTSVSTGKLAKSSPVSTGKPAQPQKFSLKDADIPPAGAPDQLTEAGAAQNYAVIKVIRELFYKLQENSLELDTINKKVTENIEHAKKLEAQKKLNTKKNLEKHPIAQKTTAAASASSFTAGSSGELAVAIAPGKAEACEPIPNVIKTRLADRDKKAADESEKVATAKEDALLASMEKELMDWQAQKQRELIEYKESVKTQRALKARIVEHRIGMIDAELNPHMDADAQAATTHVGGSAGAAAVATSLTSSKQVGGTRPKNQKDPNTSEETANLTSFEVEQLLFLSNNTSGLNDLLVKLRQRTLKYSELITFIEKLSAPLIEPGKHQGFSLIVPGPHFTAYIPNTRKHWPRNGARGYELTPRLMSTLNSWKGQYGNHQMDVLSGWAVERCEQAFIRAGITLERLELAEKLRSSQYPHSAAASKS